MQNTNSKKRSKLNVFFTVVLVVLILYTVLMFGLFLLGVNISLKHYQDIERDNNIFGLPNMYYWKVFKSNIFGNYIYAFNNIKLNKANGYIVGLFNKERVDAPIKGDLVSCSIYTIIYAGIGALCSTFMPMFMGYLCSMYRNKASAIIYAVVLFVIVYFTGFDIIVFRNHLLPRCFIVSNKRYVNSNVISGRRRTINNSYSVYQGKRPAV